MELLPSDLTARINPRLDGNDEPCALIKVIVPSVEGIQFEGWVIGNVAYRPGEYQIYVPSGTKKSRFGIPTMLLELSFLHFQLKVSVHIKWFWMYPRDQVVLNL